MPSKRVSLKGKGADLFFGDYSPGGQPSPERADVIDSLPSTPAEDSPTPASIQSPSSNDSVTALLANGLSLAPARSSRSSANPARTNASTRASKLDSSATSEPALQVASSLAPARASSAASRLAHDARSEQIDVVATIRKIVKVPGKEVAYTRLTPEEKAQLADIVYTYKRQGQRTTENEVQRIALNYLLSDYHERGERSVLAQVLAALLA